MSDTAKFQPGITCDKCGLYAEGDYLIDTDHRRQYNGRDVCVSCYVDLKLANGDYAGGDE
jgi:formylmethanofuran dehydrogenase subunit E